jgi:hypothetical protein
MIVRLTEGGQMLDERFSAQLKKGAGGEEHKPGNQHSQPVPYLHPPESRIKIITSPQQNAKEKKKDKGGNLKGKTELKENHPV